MKNKEIVNDNISGKLINKKSISKKIRVAGLYTQTFAGLLVAAKIGRASCRERV